MGLITKHISLNSNTCVLGRGPLGHRVNIELLGIHAW